MVPWSALLNCAAAGRGISSTRNRGTSLRALAVVIGPPSVATGNRTDPTRERRHYSAAIRGGTNFIWGETLRGTASPKPNRRTGDQEVLISFSERVRRISPDLL